MWHVTVNGSQKGPISEQEVQKLIQEGTLLPTDLVWKEGMKEWQVASIIFRQFFPVNPTGQPGYAAPPQGAYPQSGYPQAGYPQGYAPASPTDSKRIAAGLLAILLGSFGIHKFYLGYTSAGVIMLVITLVTCGIGAVVSNIIGLVEGVIYLTKTDADFYNEYIVHEKPWF